MSFFDRPTITDDGRLSTQIQYDEIVKEQVYISYLASGISFETLDNLSPYDRQLILKTINSFKEKEIEALKKSKN